MVWIWMISHDGSGWCCYINGAPWIPSTKTPVILAFFYQHQPDPSWVWDTHMTLETSDFRWNQSRYVQFGVPSQREMVPNWISMWTLV